MKGIVSYVEGILDVYLSDCLAACVPCPSLFLFNNVAELSATGQTNKIRSKM